MSQGAEVAVEVRVGVTEVVADAVDVGDGVAVGLVEPPHATNSIISTPQNTAKGLLNRGLHKRVVHLHFLRIE